MLNDEDNAIIKTHLLPGLATTLIGGSPSSSCLTTNIKINDQNEFDARAKN